MSSLHRPVLIESMENRRLFDASLLSETIVSSTLPATISDHAALKGTVTVNIANNSSIDEREKVVTGIVIANGALDPLSRQFGILKNKTLTLAIKSGQTKTLKFAVSLAKGKLADGVDTIYALTVNQSSAYSQSSPGPTLTVHAPIVTLSETETFTRLTSTVVTGTTAKPADKVAITNTGTDPSTDPLTIGVYATTDGIAADGVLVTKLTKKLTINPGKTVSVSLPIPGVPKLAAGTYQIITQVTQSDATVTTTNLATAPTVTVTAPTTGPLFSDAIVSVNPTYEPDPLQGFLQTISHLKMSISITNSGATTSGSDDLALFASISSTFDPLAVQVGQITLALGKIPGNGGVRTFNADFGVTSNFPGTADANGNTSDYIYVQITDPAGNVTMASYPSAIIFAGPII